MSEVSDHVDRKLIRREFNTEALLLSGFTEEQLVGLGDLGEIGTDRLHELLWSKLGDALGRATESHHPIVKSFHPEKRSRKPRKGKRSRK